MLVGCISQRVAGELPECGTTDDARGHRCLQVQQQPAGDEVGVGAAECRRERERPAQNRVGMEEIRVVGRDGRCRQGDVLNVAASTIAAV